MILVILGIIFFFIYSFLNFSNLGNHFTWPDETANYFFINNFIQHSSFSVPEPLNAIAGDLIKPRSFNVYQGNLVPGSFLGLLLIYGLIGKVVGIGLVKFLTPLLAVIAVMFFYKLLLKIFDPKIAFISALLFFIHPAWLYYANFSMLSNIAFLTFLIIGFYLLISLDKDKNQHNWLLAFLGSFFIALALIVRTNEFLWVLGVLLLLLVGYRKKIKWQYLAIFMFVCLLVFIPILDDNQITYGNYLSFGYLRLEAGDNLAAQLPTEFKTSDSDFLNFIQFLILPFGFHAKTILINFYHYYAALFWWLFIAAFFGGLIFLYKYLQKSQAIYFLITGIISIYLLIYYGSWTFSDQLTLHLNKIGISYVRYFLPIYILTIPLIAIFYLFIRDLVIKKKYKILISAFLTIVCLAFNFNILYSAGYDNLSQVNQNIKNYNQINKTINNLIEPNAIIISNRSDKIFFPERKVIGSINFNDFSYWLNLLKADIPLYYYAVEDQNYIDNLSIALDQYDLALENRLKITDKEWLYQIILLSDDEE